MASVATLNSNIFSRINAEQTIPRDWEARASKAWTYYIEEPLVKNCINSWRAFAMGDKLNIISQSKKGQEEAQSIADSLNIFQFVKDMLLQLLVKGDATGYKEINTPKGIPTIICLNPSSIEVTYHNGQLIKAQQTSRDMFTSPTTLDSNKIIHLKWDSPPFSSRGNSMVLPAFRSIELLRDYRKAEQAIARRWATPLRLIKVGGQYGSKMIIPDQKQLEEVKNMVNQMDLKSGLVTPFFVNVETHGANDKALNVKEKIKSVREDIMVAMGVSKTLISGEGSNFATAVISMQKMLVMVRKLKQIGQSSIHWAVDETLHSKGYSPKEIQRNKS